MTAKNPVKRCGTIIAMIVATLLNMLPLGAMSEEINQLQDNPKYRFSLISVENGSIGRFAFRHSYEKPIQLFGFGFKGTNTFQVRFEKYLIEEAGQWTNVMVYYCGTGSRYYPIEANRDYVFLVSLHPIENRGKRGIVELAGEDIRIHSTPFAIVEINARIKKKK